MTFGKEGESGARVHDLADVRAILDVFQKHGHYEIDSARVYCGGTSEEYLGAIEWKERGIVMDTKLYPMKVSHWSSHHGRTQYPCCDRALRTPRRLATVLFTV
jgi:aryl-alcohol dehydrogenase-like predicted oxidoreductase